MKDPVYHQLRELSWCQKLTKAEEAELQKILEANPEAKADWELESQLNSLLEKLPEAPPVASNFTAQVMSAVDRKPVVLYSRARIFAWGIWLPFGRWLPRAATALLVVTIGVFGFYHHEIKKRELLAQSVAKMADVFSTSKPELMANSDAIWRLSTTSAKPDVEMLALMK